MKSMRTFGVVSAVAALLVIGVTDARAASVTYQFTGTCSSGSSPGDCGYFGLSDGDLVSGLLTLDGDRLSAAAFTAFLPKDPDLDFSFTFGNFSVGKGDLDPGFDIRVMLADPSGLAIVLQNSIFACVNAVFACGVVQPGTESLSIGTSFGTASRATDFGSLPAYTFGEWTIVRAVPEPAPTVLLTCGLAGLAWRRFRVVG